jgi:hypothetical protein
MKPGARRSKNVVKPWLVEQWCLAPTADPAFVSHMEDVLDLDHRPSTPTQPVICLDEIRRQLLGETRPSLLGAPGVPARVDPQDVRGGIAQLFVVTEPLLGWRHITVGAQQTRLDFAACIKALVDGQYSDAEKLVLVMDQLKIHTTASLYAAFPAAKAHRLVSKLEIHHTPKHGSWLTMAELELSVLARQCLSQRLPDQATMQHAVTAWADRRNAATQTIDWQFATADARITLRRLYPEFDA